MSETNEHHAAKAPVSREHRVSLLHLLSRGSSLSRPRRLAIYAGSAVAVLLVIWAPVTLFLMFKPIAYTSTWALILPGAAAGHAVSLDSVGQATATTSSPYASRSVDPKVNYKAVAESDPVRAAAAQSLGISVQAFGKPRIKLVDQTALMNFQISGSTPRQAHAKSTALYNALQLELERLRDDELLRREAGFSDMLSGFSDKLRDAQQRILDYQANARIVSLEQFNELTVNLERMRAHVRDLKAVRAGLNGQIKALRDVLKSSPQAATELLNLQQDPLFRRVAEQWADASALLTRNLARWGQKHQQVIRAKEDKKALRRALVRRARAIAPTIKVNAEHLVAHGTSEPGFYRQLVELDVKVRGMDAEITSLEHSIGEQQILFERSTTDASNLEDLKRRHQVATAVFTTALAQADIGKSDRFSSYPLVQLLAAPTLPDKTDSLSRDLAVLGAAVASLFSLFGLMLLWIRKPFFQKTLKNA
ncbi:MAG: hypothetical protein ACI8W7_005014 [Gammaproteobacteria bacterium]|jgi:uncharacterized protein involved in exopolysaccharide biosynthesis